MMSHSVKTILKKELKSYFTTPLGYVFSIIFLFSIGYVTFESGRGSFFVLRQADLSSFFRYIPWLFLLLVPAVSMRLWAEERKSGTIELLLTLPVTVREAVLGKFLASWAFIGFNLLCTFPIVLTVAYLGQPDYLVILIGYLGSFLLGGAYLAIGCFFSALTKNQVISFICTVVFCYLLTMAGSPPILEFLSTFLHRYFLDLFESLSMIHHFETMGRGVMRVGDLWFFAVIILAWLYGCEAILDEKKAS
tara:strand:+ start:772 stop:1518 length:747 start_codon:yes stop_codon:yes gene_type:complete